MDDFDKTALHFSETALDSTFADLTGDANQLTPYLVIVSGKDQGRSFALTAARTSFGRSEDAEIVLADPRVSRQHGALLVEGDRVELLDLDSTNGCYVDGIKVERVPIDPNARIRVGSTVMKVEFKLASEIDAENRLYEAATTDPLTGLLNRRAFVERAEQEIGRSRRKGKPISLVMCDVDHFKRINDDFGHPAGDLVLKDLATILQSQVRIDDLLARFGGEEFVLLLRNTTAEVAGEFAERMRVTVESHRFMFDDKLVAVTLSMGIKCGGMGSASLEALIHGADTALYQAKEAGRNRVVNADARRVAPPDNS
ncbi:MAG: diguanylate cyclase [Gammaproteobacteria bacterium]|nr:diguanylate cyclase [Gammaproteobacteria bacterium]